jgi:hypothetical protein
VRGVLWGEWWEDHVCWYVEIKNINTKQKIVVRGIKKS